MPLVHALSCDPLPTLAEVGGKGLSLMRMRRAGLAVPDGFVLGVAFFEPWIRALESDGAWARFRAAADDAALLASCTALKERAAALELTPPQQAGLTAAVAAHPAGALYAVRSSSPEEDLEGSSFAGGYETVLGVTRESMPDAIRRAFASCLDARVAIYKREHGFDVHTPRIAVVVQRQIASEVAGVGFSLDPLSNAYDHAVINANWGLGETVVAGLASPDLFRVDKVTRTILARERGAKETSIWLLPDGGTVERPDPRTDELSLTDAQVLALTEQLAIIEALYGKPMDIEWAFAGGELHLLQARPITTHLQLPAVMVTPPGEPKRLYWDASISVQGLFEPISPAGTSALAAMMRRASLAVFHRDITANLDATIPFVECGRIYFNLSNALRLADHEKLVGKISLMDGLAGGALAAADQETYRAAHEEFHLFPWAVFWTAPEHLLHLLDARLLPEHARRASDRGVERGLHRLREIGERDLPVDELADQLYDEAIRTVLAHVLPYVAAAALAMVRIRTSIFAGADPEHLALAERLTQSLPGNVTVEMGLALADLAHHVEPGAGVDELLRRLEAGGAPTAFSAAWEAFLARYGHRGPRELDVAAPRYRERPRLLLEQIVGRSQIQDPAHDPLAIYERSQAERHDVFEELHLLASLGGRVTAKRFRSLARAVELLFGLRETPKFLIVWVVDLLRARLLREADRLMAAGRLDSRQQVFDLWLADVAEAQRDARLDLRERAAQRRAAHRPLERFGELPRIVDSRGRIFRPTPPPPRPGELAGQPISAGTVRGPVKVLHAPDEKPLAQGDILVARATDPGWTPLFVNAAGVVLEVGGLMQHGALIAREYGKPCVASVARATELLTDGQIVEVDGAAGVVRMVTPVG